MTAFARLRHTRWTLTVNFPALAAGAPDSSTGSQPAGGVLYGADAPLYRGQPASMLHGAGRDEGAWSRWDHQSDVWAASGGTSPRAAHEAASHVVSAPPGTAGRDSQGGRYHTAPGSELHGR